LTNDHDRVLAIQVGVELKLNRKWIAV